MLRFLRKKENLKKIMWGLAILIIPAFVLWGAGSSVRSSGPKYAGKVFGKKISFRQYQGSLLACRNQALLIYGEDFNKLTKYLDWEQMAWERLILLYQAKKERIKVSNKEVINFIEKLPLFQKQGRFDQGRYATLLDYAFRVSPRDFEEQIREVLKIDKFKDEVTSYVGLTSEEIETVYKNENEKAKAFYVLIEPQKFEDQIHPSYEELQDYYQNRKIEFKKPEQVNVEYIALYFDQFKPEVSVSEEEIALDKVREIMEEKIWQISDEIKDDPASFKEIATKCQLEVKETGFFGPQQVIPEIGLSYEFLNTAFTLKIDEVSNTIETPKGFFIIKVKEKKESHIPPLDEIKEEVETAVVIQKSWELAKNKGEEVLSQIKKLMEGEKVNFSKAAEKSSLTVKETEKFSRFSYISGIGQSQKFTQGAFELEVGAVGDLINVPNGYCILSLENIFPIDEEKFAREKEEFAKKLLARKKDVFYKIWLVNLKKKANLVSNIGKLKNQSKSP